MSGLRERDAADLGGILSLLALDERIARPVSRRASPPPSTSSGLARAAPASPRRLARSPPPARSPVLGRGRCRRATRSRPRPAALGRSGSPSRTPGRWGGLVDLPDDPDKRALRLLTDVSAPPGGKFAIRRAGVFTRRLRRATAADPAGRWTPDGTVLITGGTGALGAHVARWLADRRRRRTSCSPAAAARTPPAPPS